MASVITFLIFSAVFIIFLVSGNRPASGVSKVVFKKIDGLAYCKDCDFHAQDITYYHCSSFDECHRICLWYGDQCTHFIFGGMKKKCFLKSGYAFTFTAHPFHNQQYEAAIRCDLLRTEECRGIVDQKQWIPKFYVGPPAKFLHSMGCYFNEDRPIASFYNASQEQCTGECRRNPSCTHYNYYFGYCDMYQGMVTEEDVHKCEVPHCHCGIDCHAATAHKLCQMSGGYEYQIIQQPAPMKSTVAYQEYISKDSSRDLTPLAIKTGTE